MQRAAAAEAEAGKNAEAVRDTVLALEIRPDWKEGWWNLGTLQYEANEYAEARKAFRHVVEFAPEVGTAWALLGLCEFELKDYPAALPHLEKAQSHGFGDDTEIVRVSSYHLALLLIREGQFERATRLLNSAFGRVSLSPQVKLALGLALLRVPLLPDELDPSKDGVVRSAGDIVANQTESVAIFPTFLESYPATPFARYAFALRLEDAGRWDEALVQLREEAKLFPQSALPWIQISSVQLKLLNRGEAVSAAEKAIALDPAMPAAHESLATALEADGKGERASKERALLPSLGEKARGRDPQMIALYGGTSGILSGRADQGDAVEQWKEAMLAYTAGRYSDAITGLKPWLKQRPADGTSWAVLGLSEFALNDFENASIHLERGEQLGLSGSADSVRLAKYTLAILLLRSAEFDHASTVLASASGPGALQQDVRLAAGLALLRIAKLPTDVQPSQRDLAERAGEIAELLHQSSYDKADAEFETLLEQYPTTPFLHYAFGTAQLALSQYDEAAAQMRFETAISPTSELPFVRLASIALRKKSPADAIAPAEHALRLAANSAEAHYLLGRASLEVGDAPRAVRELEIACRLAPGSPEAHFNLAKAYAKTGQPERAAEERATFVGLNATAEEQRSHRGNQAYHGPREADDMSVPQKSTGSSTVPD